MPASSSQPWPPFSLAAKKRSPILPPKPKAPQDAQLSLELVRHQTMNLFRNFKKADASKVGAASREGWRAESVRKIAFPTGSVLAEEKDAWHLLVSRGEIEFRITIPMRTREWFVSAYLNGQTVWSDDVESYATNEEAEEILDRRFISSIEAFLSKLEKSDLRYVSEPTIEQDFRRLQWKQDSDWKGVSVQEDQNES
jgi:hypothetical protein